jgi:predicted permease
MAAFGLWMCTIGIWTLGTRLLRKPGKGVEAPRSDLEAAPYTELEGGEEQGSKRGSHTGAGEREVVGGEAVEGRNGPSRRGTGGQVEGDSAVKQEPVQTSVGGILGGRNPPLMAMFIGVVFGMVPFTKGLFVGPGAALSFISASLLVLGDAFMSAMLLVLGANMPLEPPSWSKTAPSQLTATSTTATTLEVKEGGEGAKSEKLKSEVVSLTVLARLVALPIVGIILHRVCHYLGLLPEDPLINFVMLLQFTAPTAANLGTVATYQGHGAAEVSQVALQQYLFAVPCVTCFMMYYLTLF